MTQLEDRLRTALDELAATMPPSQNAVAEHDRRVAATESRRRRPMLAAAAAAVVIAGMVGPSALSRNSESTVDDGGNAVAPTYTATVSAPKGGDPGLDEPYQAQVGDPVQLGRFTESGKEWIAFAFAERTVTGSGWGYRLCVLAVPAGEPVNSPIRHTNSEGCTSLPGWPDGQPEPKVVTRSVLGADRPSSGPLRQLLLFVAVPEVTRLDVRAGDGTPVEVRQIMRIPELVMFLADFGTSYEGFGYDARDAAGNIIESGIT